MLHSLSTLLASICVLALAASVSRGQPTPASEPSLFIEVLDESRLFDQTPLGTLYLATSAKEWNVKGVWSFGHLGPAGNEPGGWMFSVPKRLIDAAGPGGFAFKFTRGTWETVEVDREGNDIPNRTLPPIDWDAAAKGGVSPSITVTVEGFADQRGTRWKIAKASTVVGTLEIYDFTSPTLGNTRKLRVWLPPGYEDEWRRFPVFYMHDGQNCFDDATSFSGEWRVDETATRLIEESVIPPMIIVGIDNVGEKRNEDYTPIPIGARRPGRGGQGDAYLNALVNEIMPDINETYRTMTGPQHTAIGGSSLGGIISLHAAMSKPGVFGAVLAESPSFWIGEPEGRFHQMLLKHKGEWPARIFMAMGDDEYGDDASDAKLVQWLLDAEASMRKNGLDESRLMVRVGAGAKHHESAWAERLPQAMTFLFGVSGSERQP